MDPIINNIQMKFSISQEKVILSRPQENLVLPGNINTTTRLPEQLNLDMLPWFNIPVEKAKEITLQERLTPVNLSSYNRNMLVTQESLQLVNCDAQKYLDLLNLKDKFNNPNFVSSRTKCNPYEKIGRSIFGNRAAVKLANIDSLYNLSGAFNEYFIDGPGYAFCDIASAPGSWSEYLQYRRPQSQGYAISIRSSERSLDFDTSRLNMQNMKIEYGPDNTGNLYTNHLFFANLVRQENSDGVDLVMGDGGFELDGREELQEIMSSRLILTEVLIGLKCLKEKGKFLCKIFDAVLPVTQDIIYILALSFERVSIIKPISSRPANSELYVIGDEYRSEIGGKYISMIENILLKYDELNNNFSVVNTFESSFTVKNKLDIMFGNLFDKISFTTSSKFIDEDFNDFMTNINNFSIQNQTETAKAIIDSMNGNLVIIPELNLHIANLLWKIPGNINSWNRITENNERIRKSEQFAQRKGLGQVPGRQGTLSTKKTFTKQSSSSELPSFKF